VISCSLKFNRYFLSPNNVSHCSTDLGVALVDDNGDVNDGILSEGIEEVVVSVKKKKFSFINTDIKKKREDLISYQQWMGSNHDL
jgi:hypothetical protein